MIMTKIYHITYLEDWQAAQTAGSYTAVSLKIEGFIHCSTGDQVADSANKHFTGQYGLVVLVIDAEKVNAPIRFEDVYGSGILFPHIYGELNLDAVLEVLTLERDSEGNFVFHSESDNF